MNQRLLGVCFLSFFFCFKSYSQQIAFPGAEGAGKYTTGGRGTSSTLSTVFEVTNLNDDNNPGSLRYALSQAATYRTIVFRVSGTIHLASKLNIPANTTLAGQTAPGDGICIADHEVSVNGNNVIVRYIRFRLGDRYQNKGMVDGSGNEDALNGTTRSNVIIDHCTMSWSDDEAFTFYDGSNVTLQWNFITEPLNYSYHFESGDTDFERHGFGGIQGGNVVSIHHNLFAHCQNRTPRLNGNRYGVRDSVDFRNNVIYNWGGNNVYGGEGGAYNIVNNYYKYGPSTGTSTTQGVNLRFRVLNPYKQTTAPVLPYGRFYLTGNYVDGSTAVTDNNWLGVVMDNGARTDTALAKVTSPFPIEPINTQTATDAYLSVLQKAGASLPKRDTLDQRIVNNVLNRTGSIIDVQGGYPHGTDYATSSSAWPALNSLPAPTDTDHDGMPDAWEARRGLNPNSASDRGGVNANGYTNLENYLNGDSAVAANALNACVSTKTIESTNSGTWLQARDTFYSITNAVDSTNLVASVLDNASMGTFDVSYYMTNTSRTYNNKNYLGRNVTITPTNPGSITGPVTIRLYFTKSEFNGDLSTLRILRTNDNSCVTTINGTPELIVPSAYGDFGTYGNGAYLEFTTSNFGSFFLYTTTAIISTSGTLNTFSQTLGSPSATQTYSVSGYNLTDNITITPPAGYEVSADGGATWYNNTSSLVLTQSGGVVSGTTITVRLNASSAGNYAGNIAHTSNGAITVNVPVNGTTVAFAPSVVLQQWQLTTNNADDPGVRSAGVTPSTPAFNNFVSSTAASPPAYSSTYGQAFAPTGDGTWTTPTGPGGSVNRNFYEQFTVTANPGYRLRLDSIVLTSAFTSTANGRLAVSYSLDGFTTSADVVGGTGPSGTLAGTANGAFATPISLAQQNTGPTNVYALAFANGGVTVNAGQTMTIRLYYAAGTTSSARYAMLKNVMVKGAATQLLPLTLFSFNGSYNGQATQLNWNTVNEINVHYFEIEKSIDAATFKVVGTTAAKNGVSNTYSFTDAALLKGVAYYRLKMVDADGKYKFSNIVRVKSSTEISLLVYPNPVKRSMTVNHPVTDANTLIEIYGMNGVLVKKIRTAKDVTQTEVAVANLPAGSYQLVYRTTSLLLVTNFVKQD